MATKIQWAQNPDGTPGETWNPVVGCSRKSEGCKNCYAFASHDMRHDAFKRGKQLPIQYAEPFTTIQLKPERLETPLRWKKPRGVFVNSVSDLFHEGVPFDFVDQVFAVMGATPRHTYRILTKRPERMAEYVAGLETDGPVERLTAAVYGTFDEDADAWPANFINGWSTPKEYQDGNPANGTVRRWPLPNAFLGCTVENQKRANERRESLKAVADLGWKAFVSYEPALENVSWTGWEFIEQLIIGGESGPNARFFCPNWGRDAIAFCRESSIAAFMKQMGSYVVEQKVSAWPNGYPHGNGTTKVIPDGCGMHTVHLRDSHGGNPLEWPEELRVRQLPT